MEQTTVGSYEPQLKTLSGQFYVPTPPTNHRYWAQHRVFVQFINVRSLPVEPDCLYLFEAHLKVTALDDNALWRFLLANQSAIDSAIRQAVSTAETSALEVRQVRFERGSVEVFVVLGVGLNLIAAYPAMKELVSDVASLIPRISAALAASFQASSISFPGTAITSSSITGESSLGQASSSGLGPGMVAAGLGLAAIIVGSPVLAVATAAAAAWAFLRKKQE